MRIGLPWGRRAIGTHRLLMFAIGGISVLSTLFGLAALFTFDQTAGAVSVVPVKWPAKSAVKRQGAHPALLVFVHPFCSCTTATLNELTRAIGMGPSAAAAPETTILFYRPRGSKWLPGRMWKRAQELNGARLLWDEGGAEARRFGARTSGYALLYSAGGDLLFNGGVTGSRGHEGDNYGIDQLSASLRTGVRAPRSTLVFGCALGSSETLTGALR